MSSKKSINVYDFDGTLYIGDSSIDFFCYMFLRKVFIIFLIPKILFIGLLYLLRLVKLETFKSTFYSFLKKVDNPKKDIENFWIKYERKLNRELKEIIINDENAVIVSAAPSFLIEPIALKLGVKNIICSNVNINDGKWLDSNCSCKNKIYFLNKKFKKYSIEKSYSNSYSDRFVAQQSKKAYLIINKKITDYNESKLFYKKITNIGTILGTLFFFIYFLLGIILNYNYELFSNNNLLFQSDTKRVFEDYANIIGKHYRVSTHPLILFVQPFIYFINSFTHDYIIAIIIFQAIVGALGIKYLFQTIFLLNENKKISILLTLVYGFSFSAIIFNSTIELYSISSLFLILIWFNLIKDIKYENKVKLFKYILLGIACTGCLITNYSVFIVCLMLLYLYKKINLKKLIICIFLTALFTIYLSCIQENIWKKSPTLLSILEGSYKEETNKYATFDIQIDKIQNVYEDIYVNGFISNDLMIKDIDEENIDECRMIYFNNNNVLNIIIVSVFYLILTILIIMNIKNNIIINIGLLISLLGMSLLHIFYGNDCSFLYSQNFIYLIILLFATNYKKNNKIINLFLVIFLILECLFNFKIYIKLLYLVNSELNSTLFFKYVGYGKEIFIFIFIDIILVAMFYFINFLLRKRKENLLIFLTIIFFTISCMFIKFNTYVHYNIIERYSDNVLDKK